MVLGRKTSFREKVIDPGSKIHFNLAMTKSSVQEKDSFASQPHYSTEAFIAGYIAGVSGLLVGHPLDTIKVSLQSRSNYVNVAATNKPIQLAGSAYVPSKKATTMQRRTYATAETALDAVSKEICPNILEKPSSLRSILNLYSGIGVPMLTVGFVQSINFFLYESIKAHLQRHNGLGIKDKDSLVHVGISAFAAGGIVSAITSPLAIIKTKQQLMLWSIKRAAWNTWSTQSKASTNIFHKVRNFYIGYSMHFICDSAGRAVFFASYEYFKSRMRKDHSPQSLSTLDRMASACAAGMLSYSVIYPLDVVRSKIYSHSAMFHGRPPPTAYQLARDLWKEHGIKPFYRGFSVAVIRSGPVAAVALPIYDMVWEWLTG